MTREPERTDRASLAPEGREPRAVAYGPDGETIATAAVVGAPDRPSDEWYSEVHLWDAPTGDHLGQVTEHAHVVHALALAPDGAALVSGAAFDVLVHDVASGEEIFAYVHEPGPVVDAGYTTDGERIVLAGQDAALVLDATTGEEVRTIRDEPLGVTIDVAQDRLTRWWTEATCDEFLGRPCPDPPG